MCKISSHLKLCTCNKRKISSSDSYWVLYRWKKSDVLIVGDPLIPDNDFISPDDELSNQKKILSVLNSEKSFDFDIQLKNKDSLEININCLDKDARSVNLIYAFVFINGHWQPSTYDPFESERQKKRSGCIKYS